MIYWLIIQFALPKSENENYYFNILYKTSDETDKLV